MQMPASLGTHQIARFQGRQNVHQEIQDHYLFFTIIIIIIIHFIFFEWEVDPPKLT